MTNQSTSLIAFRSRCVIIIVFLMHTSMTRKLTGAISRARSGISITEIYLLVTPQGHPVECFLTPGSSSDVRALRSFQFDVPEGSRGGKEARKLRRVGTDETAEMILRLLLRGRTRVAVGEWLTSGVVPVPQVPADDTFTSRRLSSQQEAPSRPPVVWAMAVYRTVSSRVMVDACKKSVVEKRASRGAGSYLWRIRQRVFDASSQPAAAHAVGSSCGIFGIREFFPPRQPLRWMAHTLHNHAYHISTHSKARRRAACINAWSWGRPSCRPDTATSVYSVMIAKPVRAA